MASRILHARAGASVAARSVRAHGRPILTPSTAYPTLMADAGSCAGTIPAIQGLRHYGTPSNHQNVAELNEALGKVERRLDALEGKCDVGHKPSMKVTIKMLEAWT